MLATMFDVITLDEYDAGKLDLVASRMRATLVEVLGDEAGRSLYSLEWLKDRAKSHVDGRYRGAIFVATPRSSGDDVGHIIVRRELEDAGAIGLVSTIYVVPEARGSGVAAALVDAAHRWFRSQGLDSWATDTSETNTPLIRLFNRFGYEVVFHGEAKKMIRLMKGSIETEPTASKLPARRTIDAPAPDHPAPNRPK